MAKRLSDADDVDFEKLRKDMQGLDRCTSVQASAQTFMDMLYERFSPSLVLLRLFITVRYDELPEEDQRFVDGRGQQTNTVHLIDGATPIFTLLGSRGSKPEWNDRRDSLFFRCIPLASTAFIASLSMLSRQFESVGFDLGLIDAWKTKVASLGRADQYRGVLYIENAGIDRDAKGRMIVPKKNL